MLEKAVTVGAELFRADGQTDVTKLIVFFAIVRKLEKEDTA
jgi:hypothetical protein